MLTPGNMHTSYKGQIGHNLCSGGSVHLPRDLWDSTRKTPQRHSSPIPSNTVPSPTPRRLTGLWTSGAVEALHDAFNALTLLASVVILHSGNKASINISQDGFKARMKMQRCWHGFLSPWGAWVKQTRRSKTGQRSLCLSNLDSCQLSFTC